MSTFEHFYIKDPNVEKNGWEQVYVYLREIETKLKGIETHKPASFVNRDAFTYTVECASFLHTLCTQQAVRLGDLLPRLTILMTTSRSMITIFEDERMEDMASSRLIEIVNGLTENLDGALDLVNNQKFIMPVDTKKTAAAEVLDDDKDPILTVNDSYDNLQDAMRLMLRRIEQTDRAGLEKLLSPQERLFFEIREHLNKTISNFSTAAEKVKGRIQFARGTIAVQGRIDRKGLKLIPQHHVVQMAGTAMCPGFSSRDSDIMPPTFFLHDQRFVVFDPDQLPASLHRVSDTRRDKIQAIRERMMQSKQTDGYSDVLENPLQHKLFPKLCWVWLANSEAAEKLELRPTLKAELAF